MTDPRTLNCEAAANVIALVNAHHHGYDDAASTLIGNMDNAELILTLAAAIDGLAGCYEVDATEMGLTFDDYIRPLGAAVARRHA